MFHERVGFLAPQEHQQISRAESAESPNWGAQALQDLFNPNSNSGRPHPLENPDLRRQLGPSIQTWENLAQESHPELFAQDLLVLLRS
jgi:hypothetical protein